MEIGKILLVDDDDDIRAVAELTLTTVGSWQVVAVDSGEAALIRAATEGPDLILLDVMMPGMDGLTTLSRLRADAATRDIPVIFMTARVQRREIDSYLELGAAGVVEKPFDPMALPDQLRQMVAAL